MYICRTRMLVKKQAQYKQKIANVLSKFALSKKIFVKINGNAKSHEYTPSPAFFWKSSGGESRSPDTCLLSAESWLSVLAFGSDRIVAFLFEIYTFISHTPGLRSRRRFFFEEFKRSDGIVDFGPNFPRFCDSAGLSSILVWIPDAVFETLEYLKSFFVLLSIDVGGKCRYCRPFAL